MAQEHWFDVMSKAALQATTRRGVIRSAAVLLPSLLVSSMAESAGTKKKASKKKSGKKKADKKKGGKKDKGTKGAGNQGSPGQGNGAAPAEQMGPPEPHDYCYDLSLRHEDPQPPSPDRVEQAREWENDCREIEAQCQAPDDFCIYFFEGDITQNRGAACCPSPKKCCGNGGCFDTQNDRDHCGPSCTRCAPSQECINGTCVHQCVGGNPGSGYENWTQPCPGAPTPCIPYDALCCGDYWCEGSWAVECCNDGRSCRRADETCNGAPSPS